MKNKFLYICLVILGFASVLHVPTAHAQDAPVRARRPKVNVTIVETEIGFDQIEDYDGSESKLRDIKPSFDFRLRPRTEQVEKSININDIEVKKGSIIQTNRALKRIIEENDALDQKNRDLDLQLRNIRGQRRLEVRRMENLESERDAYREQIDDVVDAGKKMETKIAEFRMLQQSREVWFQGRVTSLEEKLVQKEARMEADLLAGDEGEGVSVEIQKGSRKTPRRIAAADVPVSVEKKLVEQQEKSLDILAMVDELTEESRKMRSDEARMHYNMGNIFFKQGNYKRASKEYEKTIDIMPEDANAHFNLAFVNGEYLLNHQKSLDHYRQYVILSPYADDMPLVQEKIIKAEMFMRARIPSLLEKDVKREKAGSIFE